MTRALTGKFMRSPAFDFRLMRRGMSPHGLEVARIGHENKEALGSIALGVFTAASNAGATFQEALLAVYITGIENGSSAQKESVNE